MNENTPFPDVLYRGDSDSNGARKLRATINNCQYQTNLLSGGNGDIIFASSLVNLIKTHIVPGWNLTHFFSLSQDKYTAYKYGTQNPLLSREDAENQYTEYFEDGNDWNFALIQFDLRKVQWKKISKGSYEGTYDARLNTFTRICPSYKVIIFQVSNILSDWKDLNSEYHDAYSKALNDLEWLLLPATYTALNFGKVEFSGILDGGDFISHQKMIAI